MLSLPCTGRVDAGGPLMNRQTKAADDDDDDEVRKGWLLLWSQSKGLLAARHGSSRTNTDDNTFQPFYLHI